MCINAVHNHVLYGWLDRFLLLPTLLLVVLSLLGSVCAAHVLTKCCSLAHNLLYKLGMCRQTIERGLQVFACTQQDIARLQAAVHCLKVTTSSKSMSAPYSNLVLYLSMIGRTDQLHAIALHNPTMRKHNQRLLG
jgi:hypothetical protein